MEPSPAVYEPRGSNVPAVLGLVFGIVALVIGWVPICGSIPGLVFALIGIPLGAVGVSIAKRDRRLGMGMPVTGLVLSCVGFVVAAATTVLPIVFIKEGMEAAIAAAAETREAERSRREAAAASPSPYKDAAVYFVRSESHVAGTGFVIDTDAGLFAVTAEHPFGGETPTGFFELSLDDERDLTLGGVVERGGDVFVLRLAPGEAPGGTLRFPGPMPVNVGDRVAILTFDGPVYATVSDRPIVMLPGAATLDTPMEVAGLSGAPVILEATGTPVGVVQGADDPQNASVVTFVKLRFSGEPERSRPAGSP